MRANVTSIELGGVTNLAVLAPVKAGFVAGFETITYLDRLRRLLRAMHASRQNQRESELRPPTFPDSIGRFGIIRSFRYAIVPPRPAAPGLWQMSLNVSFDGGWEPYMRVIYRDIGTLLDALFCHCEGYPGSRSSDYDTYCRWVRDNEFDGGIFYNDSALTQSDANYLAEVERLQRETADREQVDQLIARFALDGERQQIGRAFQAVWADPKAALALSLRSLKGLYRLATYFPDNPAGDGGVLRRFAQSVLKEFRLVIAQPELAGSAVWQPYAAAFAEELAWLRQETERKPLPPRLGFAPAALQAMVLGRADPATHGCVVMLGVRQPAAAAVHLANVVAPLCGVPASADAVRHHVAFTFAGLQALGVHGERLDRLPQEFAEGMEARSGLLGDVRSNHPDHWRRPLRHAAQQPGERIDLTTVHVVVVLRLVDDAEPSHGLHTKLAAAAEALAAGTGLALLAVQPTRSYRSGGQTREHFGFVDGLSQPQPVDPGPPKAHSDEVRAGELLLGYHNDRGDDPFPPQADALLDNGSFLVLRKLRQRVDHLDAALAGRTDKAEVLARMMGRRQDGAPPVPLGASGGINDFDYDSDPGGARCPFHSHVRRTNPRDGRAPMPRILRRGMSYGPRSDDERQEERGIVFMAYCASIAEQFETLQRWVAGGNSSGVSSTQADPFLAVPRLGEKRTFRYVDAGGRVVRVDLGDQPFVELEWGLYLFAPSLAALRELPNLGARPAAAPAKKAMRVARDPLEPWRRRLEDPDHSVAEWAKVRAASDGLVDASPYGTLIGRQDAVLGVLKDDGAQYSVRGYGRQMAASIGLNHLGLDAADGHDELAAVINPHIVDITAPLAFATTLPIVRKLIAGFTQLLTQPDPSGPQRVPIDLMTLSERVLAALCTRWIGLPEADVPAGAERLTAVGGRLQGASGTPRCPGHLLSASRYVFAPHPRPEVVADGPAQGQAALEAVRRLLREKRPLGELAEKVQKGLVDTTKVEPDSDLVARNIAGLLLGFPPTVHGNFLRTMETWIDGKGLWAAQQRLAEQAGATDDFARAETALRPLLFDTMRRRPVPEMLWRTRPDGGKVVLGIASVLTDPEVPDEMMFGGSCDPASPVNTPHACPGYGMGTGVLLALIAGLLDAGTLRPTGSPVLLMLTPHGG
jgi:Dyp-type peroxidase family